MQLTNLCRELDILLLVSCGRLSNWTLNLARIHTQLSFAEGKFILANGMIFF